MSKPELMLYKDEGLTKPLDKLKFGMVDEGDTKAITFYAHNPHKNTKFINITYEVRVNGHGSHVELEQAPTELQSGDIRPITLRWTLPLGMHEPLTGEIVAKGVIERRAR